MRFHNPLLISLLLVHTRCIYCFLSQSCLDLAGSAPLRRPHILQRLATCSNPAVNSAHDEQARCSNRPLGSKVEELLRRYGYDRCIVTLEAEQLPVVGELFENGQSSLVSINSFVSSEKDTEPKAQVSYIFVPNETESNNRTQKVVSFSDFATIWFDPKRTVGKDDIAPLSSKAIQTQIRSMKPLRVERALDRLYQRRVGTSRSPAKGITKKQVAEIAIKLFPDNQQQQGWAESIMRQVIKAGVGFSRLVSSDMVREDLYKGGNKEISLTERAVSAVIVSNSTARGGRFKRFPCTILETHASGRQVSAITFVNGGWLVSDQSVRAGTEGRNFAERRQGAGEVETLSDQRIIRRLECLALGEAFSSDQLQVDVREALKAMNLPVTRKGACDAMVRIGRWSGNEDLSKVAPWSAEIIKAAAWFDEWATRQTKSMALMEQRVDLTKYPCVCIDAKQTAFRDDAIGIRPRSVTGRKVVKGASKWEILVHVVDTSAIYGQTSESSGPLAVLKGAAESRVASRYDLPRPLHLMPPRVLSALSFGSGRDVHCCLTMWAYIDERDGSLVEAGLERTIVAPPRLLSYSEVTSAMEGDSSDDMSTLRSMLLVLERNLSIWRRRLLSQDSSARRREEKLVERERAAAIVQGDWDDFSDDERGTFQRTRGHRLVDAALTLYGLVVFKELRRARVPIPMTAGAEVTRGGRLATAPLRRYIDGMAQLQVHAALCNYGRLLNAHECRSAGKLANDARNAFANVRARKQQLKS